jgi:hypothetical protein
MSASSRARRVAGLLVALAAALALTACGGGATNKSPAGGDLAGDGARLTKQASGPNGAARAGVIDGKVSFTLKGLPGYEGFSNSVSGPFAYRKGASLPDYELEIGARDYGVGLTSVGGRSWVSLGSTGYALPAGVRRRLVKSSAKGSNGLTRTLEQFGIAPWRWETKQRVAGFARLDGVQVVRVSTGAEVGRILRDANTLLGFMSSLGLTRATGLPREIGPAARRVIVHNVKSFQAASWIGVKDHVLRRSRFSMTFSVPAKERAKVAGISAGTVVGELNVTEVGRRQEISKPSTVGSIADFRVGIDAVGDAQDAKAAG